MRELDLHGLTVDEALRVFVDYCNRHARSNSPEPLRIIHGYGSSEKGGKIRKKIRTFLEAGAKTLDWKPGEDFEGNPGVTIVYPQNVLRARKDQFAADILAFCSIPRSESKIAGEFRKYGARETKEAIRTLVRRAQMKEVLKGGITTYVRSSDSDQR